MENQLIPEQLEGSHMDLVSTQVLGSSEEATALFLVARQRLFDVSNWHKVCGSSATCFHLTDEYGQAVSGMIEGGRLIRIDIPGPGPVAGDGYDWVKIEKIAQSETEASEWAGFIVRPCPNPIQPELGTAHFFSKSATSTFLVKRLAEHVSAEMHGRNEKPNEDNKGVFDGIRNAMVGYSAKIGLSFPQWKLLVDGLVKMEG